MSRMTIVANAWKIQPEQRSHIRQAVNDERSRNQPLKCESVLTND